VTQHIYSKIVKFILKINKTWEVVMKKSIVVITSKSAGGKTVLMEGLMRIFGDAVGTIQSTTTRNMRPDDKPTDYEFVSFFQFLWALITGKFVSWRKATKKWFAVDDFYAIRKERINEALASDKIYIRSLTPDTIMRWYKVAGERMIFIHLMAPDEEEARRRMIARGGMTLAQIDERIREEKNWDKIIEALKEAGIPIHIIPIMSLDDVLENVVEIIESNA
jgi:guanylate kinase